MQSQRCREVAITGCYRLSKIPSWRSKYSDIPEDGPSRCSEASYMIGSVSSVMKLTLTYLAAIRGVFVHPETRFRSCNLPQRAAVLKRVTKTCHCAMLHR
jgi:hypothetical protein